jgi:SAM-dependent methyltransferase
MGSGASGDGANADFVVHKGAKLPLPLKRFCGPEFRDNEHFLRSAEEEALRIVERCALPAGGAVLDIGCGQGRLATGLLRKAPGTAYLGIDVDRASVEWCDRHLSTPAFRFQHIDVENARYNPKGRTRVDRSPFRFELVDGSIDLIYAYSVFSHMELAQIEVYLAEFKRVLKKPSGAVFLTTFVEENLPKPFEINPHGYAVPISGPLHVVRFDRRYWAETVAKAGLKMSSFEHGVEANGQSGIYLSHL